GNGSHFVSGSLISSFAIFYKIFTEHCLNTHGHIFHLELFLYLNSNSVFYLLCYSIMACLK
uniref:Uncharacterized protein n=1 Tax=Sinocyclocheilus rhinocerous TaxID=307959 RepID=A0A673FVT2_9TELE